VKHWKVDCNYVSGIGGGGGGGGGEWRELCLYTAYSPP